MVRTMILPLLGLAVLWGGSVRADADLPIALRGVRFDQRLNEQVPLDLIFKDEAGSSVSLRDYFGKKPVILVLAYFKCPMLCTQVLNGLVRAQHRTLEIRQDQND